MNMGWGGLDDGWYSCDEVPEGLVYNQGHATAIAPHNVVRFVGGTDPGDGSPDDPHENIVEAIQSFPDHATLIFKAGSTNYFSTSPLVIDRPCKLWGINVVIRRAP
jgi:hypothetical protein